MLKVPASCLAEFATRGGRSPEAVLAPFKFEAHGEGKARIVFYPPVLTVLRRYLKQGRKLEVIENAICAWRKKASVSSNTRVCARLHADIAALEAFRHRYKERAFRILPSHKITYSIGPLVLTSSPDFWIAENGRDRLLKLGFGKKKRSYVDVLLVLIRRAALSTGHRVRKCDVVYLNVLTGEELHARFSYRQMAQTLTTAARQLAEVWPRVKHWEITAAQIDSGVMQPRSVRS